MGVPAKRLGGSQHAFLMIVKHIKLSRQVSSSASARGIDLGVLLAAIQDCVAAYGGYNVKNFMGGRSIHSSSTIWRS